MRAPQKRLHLLQSSFSNCEPRVEHLYSKLQKSMVDEIPDMSADDCATPLSSVEDRLVTFDLKVPIFQLDDDALGLLFMLNTYIDVGEPHSPSQTIRATSQVCQRWRMIALGYPALWAASLDFSDPVLWRKEVLLRAGHVPLNITLPTMTTHLTDEGYHMFYRASTSLPQSIPDLMFSLTKDFMPDFNSTGVDLPPLHHSRNVALKIRKTEWASGYVKAQLTFPWPNLINFALVIDVSQSETEDYTLPEDVFQNHAPHLRTIHLRGCGHYFPSSIFRNLTKLVVQRPCSDHIPSAELWLDILARMPELQELRLDRCFYTGGEKSYDALPFVVLPNLHSLALYGSLMPCSKIFTQLQCPPSCRMIVECYRVRSVDYYLQSMITSFLERVPHIINASPERSLVTFAAAYSHLCFEKKYLACEGMHDDMIYSFKWVSNKVGIESGIWHFFFPAVKAACSDALNVCLRLRKNCEALNDERLAEIFNMLGKVNSLKICLTDTFKQVISVLNDNASLNDCSNTFLPDLHSIELENVYFDPRHDKKARDLCSFVGSRSNKALGIEKIRFHGCSCVSNLAGRLEGLGVRVVEVDREFI